MICLRLTTATPRSLKQSSDDQEPGAAAPTSILIIKKNEYLKIVIFYYVYITASCNVHIHTQQLNVIAQCRHVLIHPDEANGQLIVGVHQKHCVRLAEAVVLIAETTFEVGIRECG